MYVCFPTYIYLVVYKAMKDKKSNWNSLTKNSEYVTRVCQSGMAWNVSVYVS